jgi:hypothetical protein
MGNEPLQLLHLFIAVRKDPNNKGGVLLAQSQLSNLLNTCQCLRLVNILHLILQILDLFVSMVFAYTFKKHESLIHGQVVLVQSGLAKSLLTRGARAGRDPRLLVDLLQACVLNIGPHHGLLESNQILANGVFLALLDGDAELVHVINQLHFLGVQLVLVLASLLMEPGPTISGINNEFLAN